MKLVVPKPLCGVFAASLRSCVLSLSKDEASRRVQQSCSVTTPFETGLMPLLSNCVYASRNKGVISHCRNDDNVSVFSHQAVESMSWMWVRRRWWVGDNNIPNEQQDNTTADCTKRGPTKGPQ